MEPLAEMAEWTTRLLEENGALKRRIDDLIEERDQALAAKGRWQRMVKTLMAEKK